MHILYRTTNLVNGKFYIGVYNGTDPSYLGSGIELKKAIKLEGRSVFKRETLEEFSTREEAYKQESKLLTNKLLENPNCYNKSPGFLKKSLLKPCKAKSFTDLILTIPIVERRWSDKKQPCKDCGIKLNKANMQQHNKSKTMCKLYQEYGLIGKNQTVPCSICHRDILLKNMVIHRASKFCIKFSNFDHLE
jgi:thiamine kinase-like enzyme